MAIASKPSFAFLRLMKKAHEEKLEDRERSLTSIKHKAAQMILDAKRDDHLIIAHVNNSTPAEHGGSEMKICCHGSLDGVEKLIIELAHACNIDLMVLHFKAKLTHEDQVINRIKNDL